MAPPLLIRTLRSAPMFDLTRIVYLGLIALFTLSCGDTQYDQGTSTIQSAPQEKFEIAPKVDILLVEDDTGSMAEAYDTVRSEIPEFLQGLENKNWNYHFATIPLTSARLFRQIMTSKHDGNWGSSWIAPFPGAATDGPGLKIPAEFFAEPSEYVDFITDINNEKNGYEPGLLNLKNIVTHSHLVTSNFMRYDAQLAIVILSTGNDNSGGTFSTRSDGLPVVINPKPVSDYIAPLKALANTAKTSAVKIFSIVPNFNGNCVTNTENFGFTKAGTRYQEAAGLTGGVSYDLCGSNSIPGALEAIARDLKPVTISYRTRFLVVERQPNPETLQIIRHDGDQAVTIPQVSTSNPNNGWKYIGHQTVYTVDYPVATNLKTGYVIELLGSAKLTGNQTAEVLFEGARP
jgi:hypothetical protein